jgi:hypothetical protein
MKSQGEEAVMSFTSRQKARGGTHKMLSRIGKRFTYTNVAMTVALVFAMSGGAFAAGKYLITSTKQISPKVLKSLQGKAGANGANGATGPAGPAGAAGPAGPQGPKGDAGAAGANGSNGEPGKEGAPGKEGSPWTAGGTLPSKATETGVWDIATGAEARQGEEARNEETGEVAISFPIPLKEGLDSEHVLYVESEGNGKECPGNSEIPTAKPGYLCAYQTLMGGAVVNSSNLPEPRFVNPGVTLVDALKGESSSGASRSGARVIFEAAGELRGTPEIIYTPIHGYGTWAVTAP